MVSNSIISNLEPSSALSNTSELTYSIRTAILEELQTLVNLEQLCWPASIAADEALIRTRLATYPEGQLVLELDGALAGILYTQRIADPEALKRGEATTVHELHRDDGPYLQLLALNVFPEQQHLGLGDQLLEAALNLAHERWGLKHAVAATRCKNAPPAPLSYADYVFGRDNNGHALDPILRFHLLHGCTLEAILPGYRKGDLENSDNAVLISYDLDHRTQARTHFSSPAETPLDVAAAVRTILGPRAARFSADRALMDLGLDSLDLHALRALLEPQLGRAIDPTFFFRYPTARAVQAHLEGRDSTPVKSSRPKVAKPAAARHAEPLAEHQGASEPIAILGMACRFPGGANSPELFWKLLREGVDAITEIPASRWDIERFYDENRNASGKIVSRYGGFLDEIAGFDTRYFEISPREAKSTDPQQRLLLELAVEALESAGIAPSALKGSRTGNFVGIFSHDYELLLVKEQLPDSYYATGNAASMAAGRLSYLLGLEGPALAVDTACSSSLAAIHLACQSLRSGESELALASGVNLILSPELSMTFSRAGMLAKDGRCRSFDREAKGYVRSEGAGTLVLKPLSQALRDRDPILALIRGTALNQDGASNGLTAPNGLAQAAVIHAALEDAGASPGEVAYVEAHGTGTSLGDPIEWQALEAVYAASHSHERPLRVGTVKSNIGHAEAAAGMAGVFKVVLSMRNGFLPPNLHFNEPNPLLNYGNSPLRVQDRGQDWQPASDALAGVSSFGFSGTNGHLILAPAPQLPEPLEEQEARPELFLLSGKSEDALAAQVRQFHAWLPASQTARSLSDLCHTAATGRDQHEHRLAFVVESEHALRAALAEHESDTGPGWTRLSSKRESKQTSCWLFSGQGSQYPGMGAELLHIPVFREALQRCDQLLRAEFAIELLEQLFAAAEPEQASPLDETALTQPALFALEYALAQTWLALGHKPEAVMGHSVGEFAAACIVGVFSLEDGLRLIARRGQLMAALPRDGGMTAIFASAQQVQEAIAPHLDKLSIGAINGPQLTVISGEKATVALIAAQFAAQGIRTTPLAVSHAFHSPLMAPILDSFESYASSISFQAPRIPLISNLDGKPVGKEIATPAYWRRHISAPVQFAPAIQAALDSGITRFLEIGPQPVLIGMARKFATSQALCWLPSLQRGRLAGERFLLSLAQLHCSGEALNFQALYPRANHRPLPLPTYPFQRKPYWLRGATTQRGDHPTDRILSDPDALIRLVEASDQFRAEEMAFAHKLISFLHKASLPQDPQAIELEQEDLFQLRWLPSGPPESATVAAFPEPAAFAKQLQSQPIQSAGLDRFGQPIIDEAALSPLLEELGQAYVLQAFERLGWHFEAGQFFQAEAMADQLGIETQHRRLLGHLLQLLRKNGDLEHKDGIWRCLRQLGRTEAHAFREQLLESFPSAKLEIDLLGHCGEHLAEVLRGTRDPVQLIFPSASVSTAVNLYQDSATFGGMNHRMGELIDALVKQLPVGHKLRILEIGGGTGGTTAHVLPHLPADCEYLFTDLSAFFTEKARERFSIYPFVRYKVFNIESAPLAQGLAENHFDLILAANVLHATKDLRLTLQNATQLLRPGGWLLPLEGIQPRLWIDLIFGLLDGWWRFADHELRPDHPLLTAESWHTLLAQNGYECSARVESPAASGALFPQAILIGRKQRQILEQPRTWLVLNPDEANAEPLAKLRASLPADRFIEACPNARFQKRGSLSYSYDPNSVESLTQLFESLNTPFNILQLWPPPLSEPLNERDLPQRARKHTSQTLALLQALQLQTLPPELWLVTKGAQLAVDAQGLAQAPLWGLIKSAMAEWPKRKMRLLDLEPGPQAIEQLCAELARDCNDEAEPLLAWRDGVRHQLRFETLAASEPTELPIEAEASYLVTGGTGGMGLCLIQRLIEQGARQIISVSRSIPPQDSPQDSLFQDYRRQGIQLQHLQLDLGDPRLALPALQSLILQCQAKGHPLRGLIHCAGIYEDRLLERHDSQSFDRVLRPKVDGAWALHLATRELKLDFFVLCSSFFAALGESGLSNYAAANGFLDTLALHRAKLGLPATSIQWGPWEEIGMAESAGPKARAIWQARGVRTLEPQRALARLAELIQSETSQAAVVQLDPGRYAESCAALPQASALTAFSLASEQRTPKVDLVQLLDQAQPQARPPLLIARLEQLLGEILGFHHGEKIDPETGFFQLGLDSLTTLELRNRLQHQFRREFPETLLFKYPTLASLCAHLLECLYQTADAQATQTPAPPIEPTPPTQATPSMRDFLAPTELQLPNPLTSTTPQQLDAPESLQQLLRQLEELENLLKVVS